LRVKLSGACDLRVTSKKLMPKNQAPREGFARGLRINEVQFAARCWRAGGVGSAGCGPTIWVSA